MVMAMVETASRRDVHEYLIIVIVQVFGIGSLGAYQGKISGLLCHGDGSENATSVLLGAWRNLPPAPRPQHTDRNTTSSTPSATDLEFDPEENEMDLWGSFREASRGSSPFVPHTSKCDQPEKECNGPDDGNNEMEIL